jgi:hypothetical protein
MAGQPTLAVHISLTLRPKSVYSNLAEELLVNVIRRHYETGRKATEHMKQNLKIVFDHLLPKWNYRAIPQHAIVIN